MALSFPLSSPFFEVKDLGGAKKGGFLFVLRKPNILECSAGGRVHKLTLNFSNVLAFQSGLGLNLRTTCSAYRAPLTKHFSIS